MMTHPQQDPEPEQPITVEEALRRTVDLVTNVETRLAAVEGVLQRYAEVWIKLAEEVRAVKTDLQIRTARPAQKPSGLN